MSPDTVKAIFYASIFTICTALIAIALAWPMSVDSTTPAPAGHTHAR